MAEEKVILETEVKLGNSTNSVKSLKAELRQVTNELATLEEGSEAFVNAAKKAGELKDRIGDIKDTVNAFNPEKKFQAIADSVGVAANGFAAMQGAMALFGSESEDLNKVIAKTQGAIALATGLNGLMGMGDAFKNLSLVIKSQVVSAFATLKASLISTGIGALVVVIGLAINEIIKYNEAIDEESNKQKKLNDELEKSKNLMEKVADASEKKRNAQKGGLDDLKRELELLTAKGATEKEIYEKNQEIARQELQNLKTKKYSGLDVSKEIADKENQIKVNELAFNKKMQDQALEDKKKREAEAKKKKEEAKSDYEFYENLSKQEQKKKLAREEEYKKQEDDNKQYNFEQKLLDDAEAIEKENEKNKQIAKNEKATAEERYKALKKLNEDGVISDKEASDAKIAIAQAEQDTKLALIAAYGQTLNQVAELLGKNTEEGKAVAIAATTIDTFVAAFRAYKEGLKIDPTGTFSIIAAAAATATGLKAIQGIINTPVPGKGGGGGGGGSMPSMPAAPAMRPTGFSTGQPSQTPPKVEPQKVYVVESDITNSQNKVARIQSKATIQ
jgi:hypothetical protein